jgi:hypothetical protein
MPSLPRRGDDLGVIPIGEHGTSATRAGLSFADRGVEMLGGGDLECLHATRERVLVFGLDQQVDVGALKTEMDDTEIVALADDDRGRAECVVGATAAQVADGRDDTEHDVNGMTRGEGRPHAVWGAGACPAGLASGMRTFASARLARREQR